MGKVVKYTGSKLLGIELRRLRGVRTLADISELSRREPLSRRIEPIASPTLSQIESGTSMPSLASLHALAVIYRVSAQHLLNLIVEDRLQGDGDLPATMEETDLAHRTALNEGRWYDDLSLTIHGGRLAETEQQRVVWRARQGACLQSVGMVDEAISILMRCHRSACLNVAQRLHVLANLLDALISAGLFPIAADLLAAAARDVEESVGSVRFHLIRCRARLNIELFESGVEPREPLLREAVRLLREAREGWPDESAATKAAITASEAWAWHLLGNDALALRDFRSLLARSEADGLVFGEVVSRLGIGRLS